MIFFFFFLSLGIDFHYLNSKFDAHTCANIEGKKKNEQKENIKKKIKKKTPIRINANWLVFISLGRKLHQTVTTVLESNFYSHLFLSFFMSLNASVCICKCVHRYININMAYVILCIFFGIDVAAKVFHISGQ